MSVQGTPQSAQAIVDQVWASIVEDIHRADAQLPPRDMPLAPLLPPKVDCQGSSTTVTIPVRQSVSTRRLERELTRIHEQASRVYSGDSFGGFSIGSYKVCTSSLASHVDALTTSQHTQCTPPSRENIQEPLSPAGVRRAQACPAPQTGSHCGQECRSIARPHPMAACLSS